MSKSLCYSCELIHSDKQNRLNKDDKGYYEITLGAFNSYNSAGQYYPLISSVKSMFEPGGALRRRLDNGQCRGELDHPAPQPGQSKTDFLRRVMTIKPDRISHHISSVRLEPAKDAQGRDVVLTIGRVKPAGPYAASLEAALENPEENVAFSIRSLTRDAMANGRWEKSVTNIVTWDYVNEPGIALANKYQTPSLEGLKEVDDFTKEDFISARDSALAVGMEDSGSMLTQVLTDMGWESVEVVTPDRFWYKW